MLEIINMKQFKIISNNFVDANIITDEIPIVYEGIKYYPIVMIIRSSLKDKFLN